MTHKELLIFLDESDNRGIWLFRLSDFCGYFTKESVNNVKISLSRHTKNEILVRIAKGFYANKRAKSKDIFALEKIATLIRDKGTIYLSLESVLSEEGLISQIPNRLVFISKERSSIFNTPFGIIEFVYSRKNVDFFEKCYYDEYRGIWVAKTELALDDAYEHNRFTNLIEEQKQKDEGNYYGHF